jgi:hypothetical protein
VRGLEIRLKPGLSTRELCCYVARLFKNTCPRTLAGEFTQFTTKFTHLLWPVVQKPVSLTLG